MIVCDLISVVAFVCGVRLLVLCWCMACSVCAEVWWCVVWRYFVELKFGGFRVGLA